MPSSLLPALVVAIVAAGIVWGVFQEAKRIKRRRAQARLVESELKRLQVSLPQIDLKRLAASQPLEDPDRPAGSTIVHTSLLGAHMFRLPNIRGIEMQVIQSGIVALTASVMALFLILISPILFTDAEKTGDYVELALPLVAILFFYLAFRFFREALILRSGTRYLVVDRNFLFQGGFFGFMKTTRVFVLRYVSALRADRGMPPTLRTLSRRRPFAAPYESECLSFQYQDENVMIAGIKAAEAAWLKNKIEQIPKGS